VGLFIGRMQCPQQHFLQPVEYANLAVQKKNTLQPDWQRNNILDIEHLQILMCGKQPHQAVKPLVRDKIHFIIDKTHFIFEERDPVELKDQK
jgi:hypothetical protein